MVGHQMINCLASIVGTELSLLFQGRKMQMHPTRKFKLACLSMTLGMMLYLTREMMMMMEKLSKDNEPVFGLDFVLEYQIAEGFKVNISIHSLHLQSIFC